MKPGAVQHQSTWHNVPGDMHMDYWKNPEKYGKDQQHTLLPDRSSLWWWPRRPAGRLVAKTCSAT